MDQRRVGRFPVDQAVVLTVLGEREAHHPAIVKNASGRGLGLEVPVPISTGTPLKIEVDDSILLGEVMYCRPEKASYFIGVEVEQSLRGLAQLSRSLSAFADDFSDVQGAYAVKHRKGQHHQQP